MAELAVVLSLLNALVQFGMLVIHCRRDKKQFEDSGKKQKSESRQDRRDCARRTIVLPGGNAERFAAGRDQRDK